MGREVLIRAPLFPSSILRQALSSQKHHGVSEAPLELAHAPPSFPVRIVYSRTFDVYVNDIIFRGIAVGGDGSNALGNDYFVRFANGIMNETNALVGRSPSGGARRRINSL